MTSPELTGGAGFTYEDAVVAYYLAALLTGTTAAGLASRVVQRVAQQQADFGEPLDDVIVDATGLADHVTMRLSLQVKRALTISDASSNTDFRDVILRSWQTLQKHDFREGVDRVGVVTGTISDDAYRSFCTVCDWARSSPQASDFFLRFDDSGHASEAHKRVVNAILGILQDVAEGSSPRERLHRLLRHLLLIKLDFLHEGAVSEADVQSGLQRALVSDHVGRVGELWRQLRQLARDGDGRSAIFSHASVLQQLTGGLRFIGSPAFTADLQVLKEQTRLWLAQQVADIGGARLDRTGLHGNLTVEMARHRLTIIKGLPGTGKTVLLRDLLARVSEEGTTLLLAANRLSGHSWAEYARNIGLLNVEVEPLLVEIAATGHSVLFIDGLDRVAPEQRSVITDVLGELLTRPTLAHWRIVATSRDTGIEPLRNWVPQRLLSSGGVGYVDVEGLSDQEASSLAETLPALRPLLTGGNERVRALARRPFFAAVLARGFSTAAYSSGFAPQSEVDLVEAWWSRGGHDAQASQTLARQIALIELAQLGAPDLGRNVRVRDLTSATQGVIPALEDDGLIRQVRRGHAVQFSHDIFFEWSFYHLLLDEEEDWIRTVTDTGEPPALARVVELLSQSTFSNPALWVQRLREVESAAIRPQWLRAWLIAPVFSPAFNEQVDAYTNTLFDNGQMLLGKLLVWMQAEKTTPNPLVLSGQLGSGDLQAAARIRLADAWGIPSDFPAWRRLLNWIMDRVELIRDVLLPDLVALFETWQVAIASIPNPTSQRIIQQCIDWLDAIDMENHSPWQERRQAHADRDSARRVQIPTNLETELRALVLSAAPAYPSVIGAYLTKIELFKRLSDNAFREVMSYSPLLAKTHPELLAGVARQTLMEELPDDTALRWQQETQERVRRREEFNAIPDGRRTHLDRLMLDSPLLPNEFSSHDLQRLSIGADHEGFFPASPLREPFHSLLTYSPSVGLALIRDVANHATTAWLQIHRHVHGLGTPLPLSFEFPWGRQEFWGDTLQYTWFRGHSGPQALVCALMALEQWALGQLDIGRPVSEVLQQLLEGHSSIAILGIAIHLALRTHEVSAVTLPLVTSQRLWLYDIQRYVKEPEFRNAGLIGFTQSNAETMHRKAVADSGNLESRRMELRSLVPLFVLGQDQQLRLACSEAIARFPTVLEFAYQEELQDAERVAERLRTAEIWSEFGLEYNYIAQQVPGRDDVVVLELHNPQQSAPDVQETLQRHAQISREMKLWLWVSSCFESKRWVSTFTPDVAVAHAVALSSDQATGEAQTLLPGHSVAHGAIAGTVAALYCFAGTHQHGEWADAALTTYLKLVEPVSVGPCSESYIPWHPKIFVAYALAARIRSGHANEADRPSLYGLIAHPILEVALAAIEGVASCWEHDQRYAWCGLNLALQFAQYKRIYSLNAETLGKAEVVRRRDCLIHAYCEYESGGNLPVLVFPLPAWKQGGHQSRTRDDQDGWHRSEDHWMGRYAAKVLSLVPVDKVMRSTSCNLYVDALEAFVLWTLDASNPAWRVDQRRGRALEDERLDLDEWQHELGRQLAKVAPYLSVEEMQARLLRPILEQPDEIAMRYLAPFASRLVCSAIIDAPVIESKILDLLHIVLDRVLQHDDLLKKTYRPGQISGFELPSLIKVLLFVAIERADMAVRFANGQWGDLAQVMPLVDRLVRQVGWIPFVATWFVTLCERAGADYPAETFADQVLAQIEEGHLPSGWKGTIIPASIAGLVQAYADRLHPMPKELSRKLLYILDALVDLGDRRSAALQQSESFRSVRLP